MANMNLTPADLISMIKSGTNPQQLLIKIMENGISNNNPLMANLLDLAKKNRGDEIERIARNLCKERGVDFDKEFNNFKKNLGF
jgi:hypothetical protein